jgi:Ca2+-binding RTX toxin-like protein
MAAAAAACTMAAPAAAQAATLGYSQEPDVYPTRLIYTAGPGETNHLVLSRNPLTGGLTFRDPGNVITPDLSYGNDSSAATLSQCTFLGSTATCSAGAESGEVRLGDKNDTFTGVGDASQLYFQVLFVDGGPGNDKLQGGFQAYESLAGGDGSDMIRGTTGALMSGGPGADDIAPLPGTTDATASYRDHGTGVTVTLDGLANDGSPGEGDNIDPRVAQLIGSNGDDQLTGSAARDTLDGLAGDDVLDGGAGDDILHGDDGNDTLTGGLGGDTLDAGAGDDVLHSRDGAVDNDYCAAGNDQVDADAADALTACEVVSTP